MAHVRAQQLRERYGIALERRRVQGKDSPFLTQGLEIVGRRAATQIRDKVPLLGPGVGTVRADAHREITNDADREPGTAALVCRSFELRVGHVLEEAVIEDALGMFGGKRIDGGGVRPLIFARPALPGKPMYFGERAKEREAVQRHALLSNEVGEALAGFFLGEDRLEGRG